ARRFCIRAERVGPGRRPRCRVSARLVHHGRAKEVRRPMENQGTGSTIGRGAESAKETARELAGTAKGAAQSRGQGDCQRGKQSGVERIEGAAQAPRKAASELGDGNAVSETAPSTADRMEGFSRTLGERDFGDLLHEAEAYAPREP